MRLSRKRPYDEDTKTDRNRYIPRQPGDGYVVIRDCSCVDNTEYSYIETAEKVSLRYPGSKVSTRKWFESRYGGNESD